MALLAACTAGLGCSGPVSHAAPPDETRDSVDPVAQSASIPPSGASVGEVSTLGSLGTEPATGDVLSNESVADAHEGAAACRVANAPKSDLLDAIVPAAIDCATFPALVGGVDPRSCADEAGGDPLPHLRQAVAVVDAHTSATVTRVYATGQQLGRNPRAVGLVGDSITQAPQFLGPYAHRFAALPPIDERVLSDLRIGDRTVIDWFRGEPVESVGGVKRDSFSAFRAAKIGAPSRWALSPDRAGATPLGRMIDTVNPAYAVVMYGSNDAAMRWHDHASLLAAFRTNLLGIVDELEGAGIVPILSTIPRRGPSPTHPHCGSYDVLSEALIAVQTNAVSHVAAEIACERALPLIDLRRAYDGLIARGLYSDGIHPNVHTDGGGVLTEQGLRCGMNARNYLVLRALADVVRTTQSSPSP